MDRTADWRRAVDAILVREYAITLLDAGLSDDEIERCSADEPDPRAFVDWFARKFDLTSYADIGFRRFAQQGM